MRPALALLVVAGSIAVAVPSFAAWPNSPFTNLPVCTAAGSQSVPVAIPDGAGGALVVWADLRSGVNDIYAQRLPAGGGVDPAWPAQGLPVCTQSGSQSGPVLVSDGAGGAIVAWQDARSGVNDVYVQHVLANGTVDPAWSAGGRLLCGAAGHQQAPAICSDGAGGAIVAWQDDRSGSADLYAHRVLASGVADAAWPADGRAVCTAAGFQTGVTLVSDGAGGAMLAWQDSRTGSFDVYAHRVLPNGTLAAGFPADGRAVCSAAGGQQNLASVSDGAGGAILAWDDDRSGNWDIYAHRILPTGGVDTDWTSNGVPLCVAVNAQQLPAIATDGAGGAIVAWEDGRVAGSDVYAQHVDARGDVDPAWTLDGVALCAAAGAQRSVAIVSDGVGGAIVAWEDDRTGIEDVYARRILASGALETGWPADGRAVSTASHFQVNPDLVGDDNGNAIVVWRDFRSGTDYDLFAQRVGRHGYLGTPEPEIVDVSDVPNDDGGLVKLSWNASYLDQQSNPELDFYDVLRSVPAGAALASAARGRPLRRLDGDREAPRPGDLVAQATATGTVYWELLASVSARHYLSGYSHVAPTLGDSVAGSNPKTAFLVVGRNSAITMYWLSRPDSGYSVDNLAPAAPAAFIGNLAAGATRLHWHPNGEADLAGYRLYRGSTADFVPAPGTLLATLPDTGYADVGAVGHFYKLTAVDVHGNESPVAALSPDATVDAGPPGLARELSLAAPAPNPAGARSTLSFGLPRESHVRLAVYDAAGRLVRELARGGRAAGGHVEAWDLRDAGGRPVGSGLYFARLEVQGHAPLVRRIAVAR